MGRRALQYRIRAQDVCDREIEVGVILSL